MCQKQRSFRKEVKDLSHTEEFGKYKEITRVVVKKFRVYYKSIDNEVVCGESRTYRCEQGEKGSDNFKPLPICMNKKVTVS
jgi:hypothetical protein